MAAARGRSDVKAFIARLPEQAAKVLRGAARAGADVVAEEAKARTNSDEVRGAIKVATKREDDRVIAKVQVKGPGAYLAPWEEYGTAPHYVRIDESLREGRSVNRINKLSKEGPILINGNFVGGAVHHPGAAPHPFLRPALDTKDAEAIATAQGYINSRVSKGGFKAGGPEGDDE